MNTRNIKRFLVILTIASLPASAIASIVIAAESKNPWYLLIVLTSLGAMHGITLLDRKGSALLNRLTF